MEEIDDSSKEVSLTLLKEFCRRMFEYVHTIPKETRNKAYISSAFKIVQKKLKKATKKQENRLEYPFIVICEVVLKALLDAKTSVIDNEDLKSSIAAFKSHLLTQLNKYYSVIKDPNSTIEKDEQLQVVSIVAALSTFGLSALEVAELPKDRLISSSSSGDILSLVSQFNTLIFTAIRQQPDQSRIDEELSGGVETLYNRQAIIQRSKALTTICEDNTQRLALLHSIIGDEGEGLSCPEKLLAARQIIMLLEGMFLLGHQTFESKLITQDTGKTEENEEELFDLSQAYSMLCGHLWKTNSIVQFSIISETLQLMLHTKASSVLFPVRRVSNNQNRDAQSPSLISTPRSVASPSSAPATAPLSLPAAQTQSIHTSVTSCAPCFSIIVLNCRDICTSLCTLCSLSYGAYFGPFPILPQAPNSVRRPTGSPLILLYLL
jgi:nucleolar pre-ribosomal-associated protein 2